MATYEPQKIKAVKENDEVVGYVFEFDINGIETVVNVTIADHVGATAEETQQNIYNYVQETIAKILKEDEIMQSQEVPKIEEEEVPVDAFVQQFGVDKVEVTDDVVENVDVL